MFDDVKKLAYEQFKIAVNQEAVERMADQFIVRREHCQEFTRVNELLDIATGRQLVDDNEHSYMWIGALKRRDAEMMRFIGQQAYDPDSLINNRRFIHKLKEIAYGKSKPALRVI